MASGEIAVERDQGAWVVTLRGEHDLSTKPSLGDTLKQTFDSGSKVLVDLSQTEFIDSTVLRALAYGEQEAADHAEHEIAIIAPSGTFASRLLRLTGIDKVIRIFETRADALAAI